MPRPRVGTLALAATLVAAGTGSAACGAPGSPAASNTVASPAPASNISVESADGPGGLRTFADCGALERRLRELTLPHVTAYDRGAHRERVRAGEVEGAHGEQVDAVVVRRAEDVPALDERPFGDGRAAAVEDPSMRQPGGARVPQFVGT